MIFGLNRQIVRDLPKQGACRGTRGSNHHRRVDLSLLTPRMGSCSNRKLETRVRRRHSSHAHIILVQDDDAPRLALCEVTMQSMRPSRRLPKLRCQQSSAESGRCSCVSSVKVPFLHISQDLMSRIVTWSASDSATGMRSRAAQIQPRDRRPVLRPPGDRTHEE